MLRLLCFQSATAGEFVKPDQLFTKRALHGDSKKATKGGSPYGSLTLDRRQITCPQVTYHVDQVGLPRAQCDSFHSRLHTRLKLKWHLQEIQRLILIGVQRRKIQQRGFMLLLQGNESALHSD